MVISWLSIFGAGAEAGNNTSTVSPHPSLPDDANVGADWRLIEGMSADCRENMGDF